jgi:hypothetical protein
MVILGMARVLFHQLTFFLHYTTNILKVEVSLARADTNTTNTTQFHVYRRKGMVRLFECSTYYELVHFHNRKDPRFAFLRADVFASFSNNMSTL